MSNTWNFPPDEYEYTPKERNLRDSRAGQKMINILDQYSETYNSWDSLVLESADKLKTIKLVNDEKLTPSEPYWLNGWLPSIDSIAIFAMLKKYRPNFYYEVGSGNSTKFARWSINALGLNTKIISIDPYPRAEIDSLCDSIIRQPLEKIDIDVFQKLSAGDILFVDNSHRSFQNSDVTVFFMEILPILNSGVVYGLHDICIPKDYPSEWENRLYNEQYLLASYIYGGANGDEILFPASYLSWPLERFLPKINSLLTTDLKGVELSGSSFWLKRS